VAIGVITIMEENCIRKLCFGLVGVWWCLFCCWLFILLFTMDNFYHEVVEVFLKNLARTDKQVFGATTFGSDNQIMAKCSASSSFYLVYIRSQYLDIQIVQKRLGKDWYIKEGICLAKTVKIDENNLVLESERKKNIYLSRIWNFRKIVMRINVLLNLSECRILKQFAVVDKVVNFIPEKVVVFLVVVLHLQRKKKRRQTRDNFSKLNNKEFEHKERRK